MHAISHSLAHRGPGASRARPRWQPYSASTPAQSLRTSPQTYLNTPASVVTPSPPSTSNLSQIQLCNTDRPRKVVPNPTQTVQIREALKNRYVTRLVGTSEFLLFSLLVLFQVRCASVPFNMLTLCVFPNL